MKVSFAAGITVILVALALGISVVVWGFKSKDFMRMRGGLEHRVTNVLLAIKEYAEVNDGNLPASIDDLVSGQYLEEVPVNPFTKEQLVLVSADSRKGPNDVEMAVIDVEHEKGHYLSITLTVYRSNGAVLVRSGPVSLKLD